MRGTQTQRGVRTREDSSECTPTDAGNISTQAISRKRCSCSADKVEAMAKRFTALVASVLALAAAVTHADTATTMQNFQNLQSLLMHFKPRPAPAAADHVVLRTPKGQPIRVDVVENGTKSWIRARGIQYAQHPVGELRFQPPVPMTGDGEIDARAWGDDCVNAPFMSQLSSIQTYSMSESCLYLNIWAPYNASQSAVPLQQSRRPVLFWIHGTHHHHANPPAWAPWIPSQQPLLQVAPSCREAPPATLPMASLPHAPTPSSSLSTTGESPNPRRSPPTSLCTHTLRG